jgi:hypothetical protein
LEPAVKKAKTFVPLNPAVQPLIEALASDHGRESRWKLIINPTPVGYYAVVLLARLARIYWNAP